MLEAVHIEFSGSCNLNCCYCYHSAYSLDGRKKDELTVERWYEIIDEIVHLGCFDFAISGGEPFVLPEIINLIDYIAGKQVKRIAIFTNGMLLNKEILSTLSDLTPKIEFRVSYDGLKKGDIARKGAKHVYIRSMIELMRTMKFPVVVNTLATKYSVVDIFDTYKDMVNIGIQKWLIDFPFRDGRAQSEWKTGIPCDTVLDKICQLTLKYINEQPNFVLEVSNLFKSQMLTNPFFVFDKKSGTCSYMKNGITIRPNGQVLICPTLDYACGNVSQNELKPILSSKKRYELLNITVDSLEKCNQCKYLSICGGGCRADALIERGSLYTYDPVACKLMETMEEKLLSAFPLSFQAKVKECIEC